MAQKNALEAALGVRFQSSRHWDPHPVVGFSALCFAAPATAFLAVALCIVRVRKPPYSIDTAVQLVLYLLLGLFYSLCVLSCALADYAYIRRCHRSRYGAVDIRLASAAFLLSVLDFALRASLLETAALTFVAVAAFAYSGLSSSFRQWVFRHSLWHVIAGVDASYGALRLPPEPAALSQHLGGYLLFVGCAYACTAGAVLAFLALLPAAQRDALWRYGASFADWRPVAGAQDAEPEKQLESSLSSFDESSASEGSSA